MADEAGRREEVRSVLRRLFNQDICIADAADELDAIYREPPEVQDICIHSWPNRTPPGIFATLRKRWCLREGRANRPHTYKDFARAFGFYEQASSQWASGTKIAPWGATLAVCQDLDLMVRFHAEVHELVPVGGER
jgi:hypothetical protein